MIRQFKKSLFYLLILSSWPCFSMDQVLLRGYEFLMQHGDRIVDITAGAFNLATHMPQSHRLEPGQFIAPEPSNDRPDHDTRHSREINQRREGQTNFEMINLINEANMRLFNGNFDAAGYLHSLAEQLVAEHSSVSMSTERREADIELAPSIPVIDAGDAIIKNACDIVVATLQSDFNAVIMPAAAELPSIENKSEPRFSSDAAFDNRHALEMPEFAKDSGELSANQSNKISEIYKEGNSRRILTPDESFKKLETLMSFSDDPYVMSLQIDFGRYDYHLIPTDILSPDLKNRLRTFFFDEKGHFKPINSAERQEEIAIMLAPAFKNYFTVAHKEQDYVPFLRSGGIHGSTCFRYIRDYETGNDDFIDYIGYGLSAVGNFLCREPLYKNDREIRHSLFLSSAIKIASLSRDGHMSLAKEMLEQLKSKINLKEGSFITSSEYKCLEVIFNAYQKKNEEKLKQAALTKVLAEQALLKSSEVPSGNQLPMGSGGGAMPPGDPQKDKGEDHASVKTSIKDTKTFRKAEQQILENAERFEKLGIKPLSKKSLKHIINEHTPAGERGLKAHKSLFNENEDIIELLLNGWEKGTKVDEQIKIYDAGRIVGLDKEGNITAKVKVVLDETMTAFGTIYPI